MSNIEDRIVSILKRAPADPYTIYRKIGDCNMNDLNKILSRFYRKNVINIVDYKKSKRTGLNIPVYCLSSFNFSVTSFKAVNFDSMIAGITSERAIEFKFLVNNLTTLCAHATILDIGTGDSGMVETLKAHNGDEWNVTGIDVIRPTYYDSNHFCIMDGRFMGFACNIFDLVICISTIEHIGSPMISCDNSNVNVPSDTMVLKEICRVLKSGGRLIITMPFGKANFMVPDHRVYDTLSLNRLLGGNDFKILKKEFYLFDLKIGKWKRGYNQDHDFNYNPEKYPSSLHSPICLCLSLEKVNN